MQGCDERFSNAWRKHRGTRVEKTGKRVEGTKREREGEREVKLAGSADRLETRGSRSNDGVSGITGKSAVGEPGGSAVALPDRPALEAARDAPSHELHDSEPTGFGSPRSNEEPNSVCAWRRLAVARQSCGRVSAGRPSLCLGVIRQGREPTDRLVKSRPGRRYRRATSRASPFPLSRSETCPHHRRPAASPPLQRAQACTHDYDKEGGAVHKSGGKGRCLAEPLSARLLIIIRRGKPPSHPPFQPSLPLVPRQRTFRLRQTDRDFRIHDQRIGPPG